MFIARTMSRWFELFGESQPSATLTPRASSSGIRPCSPTPRRALGRGDRAHRHRRCRCAPCSPSRRRRCRARGPARRSVRARPIPSEVFASAWARACSGSPLRALAPLLWCSVSDVPVSSASRLSPRSSSALHVSAENGIAHARRRPFSRPCHFLMNARRPIDRLGGGVARQRERRVAVAHAVAHQHADAGVLVGLQAGVGKLGAARVHEAHRAVLQQLHDAEQRGGVLLLLRHRHLQR